MQKSIDASTTEAFSPMKSLYLFLMIVGSIAPWFWLLQDPAALLSPNLFLQRAFENNVAAALTSDLLISAIAFFCFVWIELKRLGISRFCLLVYIGLTFGVGGFLVRCHSFCTAKSKFLNEIHEIRVQAIILG